MWYDPRVLVVGPTTRATQQPLNGLAVPPAIPGQTQTITVYGQPVGGIAAVLASVPSRSLPLELPQGLLLLDTRTCFVLGSGVIGTSDPRFRLPLRWPTTLPRGEPIVFQAVTVTPRGNYAFTNPSFAVVR